jgi:glycerol-3-phosphate O-acyltransferase/dihydroxyacetone phosphate acyltransferase
MYRLIAFLVGLTADLFYRRHQMGARIPDDGPVLIVANHPNALADPALLLRVTTRQIRSLAKEPLFRMPVIQWLVKGANAIPVYRAKDGFDTSKNAEVFRAVVDALAHGDVVALFPEGISHDEPGLQPLKTGAARMINDALARGDNAARVRVVPVGLTYRDKPAFRSDALVHVGEPIDARAFVDTLRARGEDPVRGLTDVIAERLRALTIDLERFEDAPLVDLVTLFLPASRAAHAPIDVANAARTLKTVDPERYASLKGALAAFHTRLKARGLDAAHLDIRYTPSVLLFYVVRHSLALFAGLPLFLVGTLAYGAPFFFLRAVPRVLKTPADTVATVRILGGLFIFPVWHLLLAIALVSTLPTRLGLPLSIALPFVALYAHAFFRRRKRMVRDAAAFFRLAFSPSERASLTEERERVRHEVALAERSLAQISS